MNQKFFSTKIIIVCLFRRKNYLELFGNQKTDSSNRRMINQATKEVEGKLLSIIDDMLIFYE